MSVSIEFCTLGMFILDDIYPPPTAADQTPQKDIIGGAGTYSALGARLFCPSPTTSQSVGWIVDAGPDFPPEVRSLIISWDTGVLLRDRPAPTTRGWNGYSGNEHRAFKYLTEKLRLTAADLSPTLLASKSFHLICSPLRCIDQTSAILTRRREAFSAEMAPPIFIWEPVPDLCVPAELENTYEALRSVDVVSPNHAELAALFGFTHSSSVSKTAVETHAQRFVDAGIGPSGQGAIVVRVGAEGCYVQTPSTHRWLPAYHTEGSRVVDPTGGGNGFLGGLAIGLVRSNLDIVESARYGSVAASFCIEQVGMPRLTSEREPGDVEAWNGASVVDRMEEYRKRTS